MKDALFYVFCLFAPESHVHFGSSAAFTAAAKQYYYQREKTSAVADFVNNSVEASALAYAKYQKYYEYPKATIVAATKTVIHINSSC